MAFFSRSKKARRRCQQLRSSTRRLPALPQLGREIDNLSARLSAPSLSEATSQHILSCIASFARQREQLRRAPARG